MMREFGLTRDDVVARVSDRRLLAALLLRAGLSEAQLPAAYAAIDKAERDPRDVLVARLGDAGVGADVAERALDLARRTTVDEVRAAHGADPRVAEALDRLARYFAYLEALGAGGWAVLDLTIVRGLAYYTGVVFELFDARGEFRAICGGGRTTRSSARSAAPISRPSASAWVTWCSGSCCGNVGSCPRPRRGSTTGWPPTMQPCSPWSCA
jgi:histidyl-tRNA synthetase